MKTQRLNPYRKGSYIAKVFDRISRYTICGCTPYQIAEILDMDPNRVCSDMSKMRKNGHIRETGETVPTGMGGVSRVYVLTEDWL